MSLRYYSLLLAIFELPSICKLVLSDTPLSAVSFWFRQDLDRVVEMRILYAAILTFLVIARVAVFVWPNNKGLLINAAFVHGLEIPLFGFFFFPVFPATTAAQNVIFSFIIANPLVFLYGALAQKSIRKN
jgi:hypothetical protein